MPVRGFFPAVFMMLLVAMILISPPAVAQEEGGNLSPDLLSDPSDFLPLTPQRLPVGMKEDEGGYYSNNPNSDGWHENRRGEVEPVEWQAVRTDCEPCKKLVLSYNRLMQTLFDVRYEIRHSVDFENQMTTNVANGNAVGSVKMGHMLDIADKFKNLRDALERQERELTARAQRLREVIENCEKQCTGKGKKLSGIKGAPVLEGTPKEPVPMEDIETLPFKWAGPYPETCPDCAQLAQHLNELPDVTMQWQIRKKMMKDYLETLELAKKAGYYDSMAGGRDVYRKSRAEAQESMAAAEKKISAAAKDFADTLKKYQDCIAKCPKETGALVVPQQEGAMQSCSYSYPGMLQIGPNSEYGSGAAMTDKIKSQATGMAMGALGNVLGGKGVSFGGGGDGIGSPGGGSGAQGPKTERDPTSGQVTHVASADGATKLDMRAIMPDPKQILISTKIVETPGNGTFHTMWLSDGMGHIALPDQYFIYDVYQDWKLSVWWTHDRWVDGEHVYHGEGREDTSGRNDLGSIAAWYSGQKGVENSIWANMGFKNASKGIKTLGVVFDTSMLDASGKCPLTLGTYITQPEGDPVTAVPVLADIPVLGGLFKSRDGAGAEKSGAVIMITPHSIQDAAQP